MKNIYAYADKVIEALLQNVNATFHNAIPGFDELNVIQTDKEVRRMYRNLDSMSREAYLKVVKNAYAAALQEAVALGFPLPEEDDRKSVSAILAVLLKRSNPVTRYQYNNEIDRKRSRTYEAVLTADGNASDITAILNRSAKLLFGQMRQYTDLSVDEGRLQAFRDAKVQKVRWVTQRDERVCPTCAERDNMIYEIGSVPEKHYRCRCHLVPVLDGSAV